MEETKPRIVLIDDDEDIAEVTKTFLKRRGFDVLTAMDGESGLTLVRDESPDLILLDLMLPGMDGYEVCRRIKEDNNLWHIPIIYFTARGDFSEKIAGLKSGADDYVTKPFEPEELLARIWMILNRTYNVLDANPLTKLPGNNAIQKQITQRLDKKVKFAIAQLDIDRFKSFNDEYGFERGDRAIRSLAQILLQVVKEKGEANDFVGHIGGDDFVLITEPSRVDAICKEIIRCFDEIVPKLYDEKDRVRGYLVLNDRQGNLQEFPLMSLSIAVVTNEKRNLTHIGEVNNIAAELKKYAKSFPGSNYVKDRREHEPLRKIASQTPRFEEISQLLQDKNINLFFQPIVNSEGHAHQGYEILMRGFYGSKVLSQDELFNQAIELKMEEELAKTYFEKLRVFSYGIRSPLWILSYLHPKIFLSLGGIENPIEQTGIDPKLLVYQIRTSDLLRYEKLLKETMMRIQSQGSAVCVALAWGFPLPINLLSELKPQFLYMDQTFFDKIECDEAQQTILKMVMEMSRALKSRLIASGVSTETQKQTLREAGIHLMSGKIFG